MLPAALFGAEDPENLLIGYTESAFNGVSSADVKASVNFLLQKTALKHFNKGEVLFYKNFPDLAAALQDGKLAAIGMLSEEFIELRKLAPIEPSLITAPSTGAETELLLVVRKDSSFRTINDLKGRSLAMPMMQINCPSLMVIWLETLLWKEGNKQGINSFFSAVKETKKESQAILSVYFGKVAACLVTRQSFDLASELNPQLSKGLTVIARKDKLLQGIIAVNSGLSKEFKNKIRQAFLSMPKTVEGKQVLLLFKISEIVPFTPGGLRETEDLYVEHARLKAARR